MILDKIRNHGTYGCEPRLNQVLSYMASVTAENFPEACSIINTLLKAIA